MSKRKEEEITSGDKALGLVLLCLSVLTFIALVGFNQYDWPTSSHLDEISNPLKQLGSIIAWALVNFTFGRYGSFAFPFILLLWGIKFISGAGKPLRYSMVLLSWGFFVGWCLHLIYKFFGPNNIDLLFPPYYFGLISGAFASGLEKFAGFTGAWIILAVGFLLLLEFTIGLKNSVIIFVWIGRIFKKWNERSRQKRAEKRRGKSSAENERKSKKKKKRKIIEEDEQSEDDIEDQADEYEDDGTRKPVGPRRKVQVQDEEEEEVVVEEYVFPSVELLTEPDYGVEVSQSELMELASVLEMRLEEFGVQAKVVDYHPGPVITRFDIQPAPGVKVSRIVSLQNDLSLSMRAPSIRILAPIPGEAAVGLEVPNKRIRTVRLRSIIESEEFQEAESIMTLALGMNASGKPYIADLREMPHLLVAGTTGSGKSVCLNAILASILFRAKPDEVRLALIDPKKLELSLYEPLLEHHLITPPGVKEPVVSDAESALKLLKSLEIEMRMRLNKLSSSGQRNIEEYNKRRGISRIPYLVLVVDELADLMISAGSAIEGPIARLAQMGRAVGIHLIVATQRPSVDIITGVIKANFPCRIAFQVASKVDSRTVLDANGAETLLGKGDMLYLPPGTSLPVRLHGSLITTEEIEAIVEHISRQPTMEDMMELPDPQESEPRPLDLSPADRDDLFEEAAKLVAVHQQGSVSLLQRKLKIGYARAARIVDQLEAAGVVGPFDGSKARKVLVDEGWLPEMGVPGDYGREAEEKEEGGEDED